MAATPLSPATTAFESRAASEFRLWSQYLTPPWACNKEQEIITRDIKHNPLIIWVWTEIKDRRLKMEDSGLKIEKSDE